MKRESAINPDWKGLLVKECLAETYPQRLYNGNSNLFRQSLDKTQKK